MNQYIFEQYAEDRESGRLRMFEEDSDYATTGLLRTPPYTGPSITRPCRSSLK